MKTNIYANTPPTPPSGYPSYLSINVLDATGEVEITVRSVSGPNGECGGTSTHTLSFADFEKLAHCLFSYACCTRA